jgi:predicted  nucleic acid-binding Zn-ribbon protein
MKSSVINKILLLVILMTATTLFAQSDYEMVQSFKERHQNLSEGIAAAQSLEDLNNLSAEIDNLKRDFSAKRVILDQSLYPENFNSSIEKLTSMLDLRKEDFTSITVLQTEVTALKSEVDLLNRRNTELINQITILESQRRKDAASIEELQKLVADLRATLLKRDQLIFSIVDSLTPKLAGDISAMTKQDKEQVYSQVERNNLLVSVKRSLRDNSRFLEVTSLKAGDLDKVKQQEQSFVTMWRKVGPKLVDVYANKKDKSAELKEIDNLFTVWANRIDKEAWESINEEFSLNNINLQNFNNGKEFVDVLTQYISDEIKNYGTKNKTESEKMYSVFTDSVWFKTISNEWMPYLLDNKLLAVEQKDAVEKKLSEWKSVVSPQDYTWIYAVVGLGLLFIAALILILRKKKTPADVTPE